MHLKKLSLTSTGPKGDDLERCLPCPLPVTRDDLVSEVKIGSRLGHNDHKEIEFTISVDRRRGASKTSALGMRRGDFRLFRELICKVPWENVLADAGVCQCWSHLKLNLLQAQDQAIPKSQKNSRWGRKTFWLNRNLLLEIRGKMRCMPSGSKVGDMERTQRWRLPLQWKILSDSSIGINVGLLFTVGNNKKRFLWNVLVAIDSKNNIGLLLDEDGKLPNRDMDEAGVFNSFFDSFFSIHDRSRESQCPELEGHDCENDQLTPSWPWTCEGSAAGLYKSITLLTLHTYIFLENCIIHIICVPERVVRH